MTCAPLSRPRPPLPSLIAPADELSSQWVSDPLDVPPGSPGSPGPPHWDSAAPPPPSEGSSAPAGVPRLEPRPLLDCHEVTDGEQLDEVRPGGSGLSGLVSRTFGSAVHRQAGHRESQLLLYLVQSFFINDIII